MTARRMGGAGSRFRARMHATELRNERNRKVRVLPTTYPRASIRVRFFSRVKCSDVGNMQRWGQA